MAAGAGISRLRKILELHSGSPALPKQPAYQSRSVHCGRKSRPLREEVPEMRGGALCEAAAQASGTKAGRPQDSAGESKGQRLLTADCRPQLWRCWR